MNRGPKDFQSFALPAELSVHGRTNFVALSTVGVQPLSIIPVFHPPTSPFSYLDVHVAKVPSFSGILAALVAPVFCAGVQTLRCVWVAGKVGWSQLPNFQAGVVALMLLLLELSLLSLAWALCTGAALRRRSIWSAMQHRGGCFSPALEGLHEVFVAAWNNLVSRGSTRNSSATSPAGP